MKKEKFRFQPAFTLLEMIVSLTVFMILMGGVFQAILFAVGAQDHIKLEREALMQTRLWSQDFQNSLRGASWKQKQESADILEDYRENLAQNLEESLPSEENISRLEWVDSAGVGQVLEWDPENKQLFWNESPLYSSGMEVSSWAYEKDSSLLKWSMRLESQGKILLEYQNAQNL